MLGLHALQHRGQEASGIVSFDGVSFHAERHVGLVGDTFTNPDVVATLSGDRAIGHNRYSTHGGSIEHNIQPLFAQFSGGGFAVAHNGNLTNALTLQDQLQRRGSIFQSTSDTEVIPHLGVGGRLEDRAAALELVLERQGIGQVAVVGDGKAAAGELGEQRLDVVLDRAAVGRIAIVADGAIARQGGDHGRVGEGVADQADMALGMEVDAVKGDDARRFLAAMLERVQAEHGERRRIGMTEDAENAALFAQLVVERLRRQLVHGPQSCGVSCRRSQSAG